jgi:hypothetical protein
MEYYPQIVYGAEWSNKFINVLLEWDAEEHGEFDVEDYDHRELFEELLYDEHEVEAQIKEFKWARGGYVQGLEGLEWGTLYLVVDEYDKKGKDVLEEKLDISFCEGRYSELG